MDAVTLKPFVGTDSFRFVWLRRVFAYHVNRWGMLASAALDDALGGILRWNIEHDVPWLNALDGAVLLSARA